MATGPVEKLSKEEDQVISDDKQKTAKKEEEEVLLVTPDTMCVQCKKELCDPHLLCCMHSVCRECLLTVKQQDGRLHCPKCNDDSTCALEDPPRGMRACEQVKAHCVPVYNGALCRYIEGRKVIQLVGRDSPTVVCGNRSCKTSGAKAVAFCADCWKFFCSACLDGHQLMSDFTGGHTVKSVEELASIDLDQMSNPTAVFMKKAVPHSCPQHSGEVLKWHCEGCDTLMCHACALDKGPYRPKYLDPSVSQRHRQSLKMAQQVVGTARKVYQRGKEELETQSTAMDECRERALEDTIGQGQLRNPVDVAVHANGQVYVADNGIHRVAVLTQDGQLVRTFGSQGRGAGQFRDLYGIAVSPAGRCMSVMVIHECKSSLLTAHTSGSLDKASSGTLWGLPSPLRGMLW